MVKKTFTLDKEEEEKEKNKLFNDIRKTMKDISLDSLKDARQRLEILKKRLKEHLDVILLLRVKEEDPDTIKQPVKKYDVQFKDFENKQRKLDDEIVDTERLLTEMENLLKTRKLQDNYTVAELDAKLERVNDTNNIIKSIHNDLDAMAETQNPLIDQFIKFLDKAKFEQLKRCDLKENVENSNFFDQRVNF